MRFFGRLGADARVRREIEDVNPMVAADVGIGERELDVVSPSTGRPRATRKVRSSRDWIEDVHPCALTASGFEAAARRR